MSYSCLHTHNRPNNHSLEWTGMIGNCMDPGAVGIMERMESGDHHQLSQHELSGTWKSEARIWEGWGSWGWWDALDTKTGEKAKVVGANVITGQLAWHSKLRWQQCWLIIFTIGSLNPTASMGKGMEANTFWRPNMFLASCGNSIVKQIFINLSLHLEWFWTMNCGLKWQCLSSNPKYLLALLCSCLQPWEKLCLCPQERRHLEPSPANLQNSKWEIHAWVVNH